LWESAVILSFSGGIGLFRLTAGQHGNPVTGGSMASKHILVQLVLLVLLAVPCFAQQEAAAGPFTQVETAVCASVVDREPVGTADAFDSGVEEIFFWTKCIGATDSTMVTHVWTHEGETRATVELPVKSSNWRTWSSKKILPSWTGNWEVRILDADGNIMKAVPFTIAAVPPQVEQEAAEPEVSEDEPEDEPEGQDTEGDVDEEGDTDDADAEDDDQEEKP